MLWIPLVWKAPSSGRLGGVVFGVLLAALAYTAWMYFYRYSELFRAAEGFWGVVGQLLLIGLLPLTSGLLAAKAVRDLASAQRPTWLAWCFVALSALALGFSLWVLMNEQIWDSMLDGSTAYGMTTTLMAGGVAGAMLLAWSVQGARKLAALGYGIAFLALALLLPQIIPSPQPSTATAAVGQRIVRALEGYKARAGAYPTALSELVPLDMLFIQPPYTLREGEWCYEGGADFYRLGYVFRPVMGVPPEYYEVRTLHSTGTPPNAAWTCDAELARLKELAEQNYLGP
jgi:hypothetical protein